MDKEQINRIVMGAIKAARHDHPGEDYAGLSQSIAKRITGNLMPYLEASAGHLGQGLAAAAYSDAVAMFSDLLAYDAEYFRIHEHRIDTIKHALFAGRIEATVREPAEAASAVAEQAERIQP